MNGAHTALMVTDMQADYLKEKSGYPPGLVDRVNERIAVAVSRGETVVYVRNVGRRNKQPYISPLAERLNIVSDHIIDKERASVFGSAELVRILSEARVERIEVIGIDGNCCVASSAIDASRAGFSAAVPLKYVGIKNAGRFEKTRVKLEKLSVQIIGEITE